MQTAVPLACFLSMIRPPGVQYENALLQIAPVDKSKCPYIKDGNDVGFQLFTRHNPTAYQELILGDDEKLFASNMDFTDRTVVYFHAWMEQPDDGSGIMVREAYMQRGDTNVIMVDAHHLEAGPWYFTAAQNTWYIGRFAAQFIDYLASRGLNLNNTHLIGHSLGAHAAGVAGSALKSGRVARITGLDPALPLFDGLPLEQRLDTTDAHFVDIIHTDAGIFGYKGPMGHVDFYPNGGISPQPGCELEVVLPKQLLLNKCNDHTQTHGFYTYHLTSTQESQSKHNGLESKLEKLFAYIQTVKDNDRKGGSKKVHDKNKKETETKREDSNETLTRNKTAIENEPYINNEKSDSIKSILTENENKTDDYIDQIAEASEFDVTQVEYNQETLKNKETVSLIKDSEEFVLEDDKNIHKDLANAETPKNKQTFGSGFETTNDEESTRFELINVDETKIYEDAPGITEYVKTDGVTVLNYKDPCITKTTAMNAFAEQTIKPTTFKTNDVTPANRKPNVNILSILDNTFRITRVISTLKQIKNKKAGIGEKLKNLISGSTTQKTFFRNIPFLKQIHGSKTKNHVVKRQKRFLPFFKRSDENESNLLFRMLDFLIKNRKNVLPVITVMREINTLVKSANGELNHFSKEQNNYIGAATPPVFKPISYSLELGNESKAIAFVKRLLGLSPKGDRLTVNARK